ncbi:OmpA family protein [Inquilinus sp. NPDC058860]|uniref:OmpA family protein n=1 Tax=Inquilinus sp. NPDC058860 TaxID=3346652 RepID=UPI0036A8248F
MKSLTLCAAGTVALLLATPVMAQQPARGIYLGAGAGVNIRQDQKWTFDDPITDGHADVSFDTAPAGNIYIGYDFGAIRADLEGSFRQNDIGTTKLSYDSFRLNRFITVPGADDVKVNIKGHERTIGLMANVYYDFEFGSPFVPYVGGGIGVGFNTWKVKAKDFNIDFEYDSPLFAYQGIAGVSYYITPKLAANLEYRYFGETDAEFTSGSTKVKLDAPANHTILLGIKYVFEFGAASGEPAPEVPADTGQRSYLVFFDFDSSSLTPEARSIVASAATDALRGESTRIGVTGHTDRSGTDAYNQALSVRRAEAVRRELVADGVADSLIVVRGVGEADPLVPTADGVREPQNRRVEIVMN